MLNALTGFYNGGIRVTELSPGVLLNLIVLADDQFYGLTGAAVGCTGTT